MMESNTAMVDMGCATWTAGVLRLDERRRDSVGLDGAKRTSSIGSLSLGVAFGLGLLDGILMVEDTSFSNRGAGNWNGKRPGSITSWWYLAKLGPGCWACGFTWLCEDVFRI
ncbi:unnamed protein product [Ostreobium quekettii]|uniref:Uncharacterized protein n=1 Tax=Ostreobium quekettii TaxID=121088 RepID=A0A8S1IQU7_9CHLO|nr:unnamed protein product [Ostreobium quekettii]